MCFATRLSVTTRCFTFYFPTRRTQQAPTPRNPIRPHPASSHTATTNSVALSCAPPAKPTLVRNGFHSLAIKWKSICRTLFTKHVFPMFVSPTAQTLPSFGCFARLVDCLLFSKLLASPAVLLSGHLCGTPPASGTGYAPNQWSPTT